MAYPHPFQLRFFRPRYGTETVWVTLVDNICQEHGGRVPMLFNILMKPAEEVVQNTQLRLSFLRNSKRAVSVLNCKEDKLRPKGGRTEVLLVSEAADEETGIQLVLGTSTLSLKTQVHSLELLLDSPLSLSVQVSAMPIP